MADFTNDSTGVGNPIIVEGGKRYSNADLFATLEKVEPLVRQVEDQKQWVVVGWIAVALALFGIFIAVMTMWADYYRYKQESYEDLRNELKEMRNLFKNQCTFPLP
jgi:hypothetical protein